MCFETAPIAPGYLAHVLINLNRYYWKIIHRAIFNKIMYNNNQHIAGLSMQPSKQHNYMATAYPPIDRSTRSHKSAAKPVSKARRK